MGIRDQKHHHHHHMSFHFHIPLLHHHHHHDIPKGYVAILVGNEEKEELQRFVIPVIYINHPLFMDLLKEAEKEYGFDHKGPITIPCHVADFRHVQGMIDEETHHHHHNNQHNHHHLWCFKV